MFNIIKFNGARQNSRPTGTLVVIIIVAYRLFYATQPTNQLTWSIQLMEAKLANVSQA